MGLSPQNIELISCGSMIHISDIKLIRTDTTLDLSQKAEKGVHQRTEWVKVYALLPKIEEAILNDEVNSDIKLIRTDTTLDLSQKAEKVMAAIVEASSPRTQSLHFCLDALLKVSLCALENNGSKNST
nr:hypothetical protein MTR_4g118580 [Ipomoea trifida]